MSKILIEKLRKSREIAIVQGDFTFTVRRPTDLEIAALQGADFNQGQILREFVVDWSGVREIDIIPGGTGLPVAFDRDLFVEWVADHVQYWVPLTDAIFSAYNAHQQEVDESLKKQPPG